MTTSVAQLTKCETVILQLIEEEGVQAVKDAISVILSGSKSLTSVDKLKQRIESLESTLEEIHCLSSDY